MKKSRLLMAFAALGLCAATVSIPLSMEVAEPLVVHAEEQEAPQPAPVSPAVAIKVEISFRDDDSAPYAAGDEKIGSYYLSADGWKEGEDEPIILNAIGNVTSKLDGKVLYLYEYRPTNVVWGGKVVKQQSDKTFILEKPEIGGTYSLSIGFTRTMINSPTELTSINWASLLTVQNLMTIGAWAIIVIGLIAFCVMNMKQKAKGSTTLDSVKNELKSQIKNVCGEEIANQISPLLDKILHETLAHIDGELASLNNNNATLARCFLLAQENTPEARLAITKCLTELDLAKDGKAEEIKAMIEAEIARNLAERQKREQALERAEQLNSKWTAPEEKPAEERKPSGDDGYGTL